MKKEFLEKHALDLTTKVLIFSLILVVFIQKK
jgi:hypothetical protein